MKLDHLNPLNSKKLHNLDKEFFFFSNLFEKNKYPRVSMITGEKGIGKSTLIIHIIAHLLDPKNYNKKNFQIINSSKFLNLQGYNLIYIQNNTNKSFNIDDCRELKRKLEKSNINKEPRIILVDDADLINLNTVNALLKITEEPLTYNYFIFINNSSREIFSTLKSRCIKFVIRLKKEEKQIVIKKLIDQHKIESILNYQNSNISPGNYLNFNYLCNTYNLKVENKNIIKNLNILLDAYKKDKDIQLVNFMKYLFEIYFYNKEKTKQNFSQSIIDNNLSIFNDLSELFNHNLNQRIILNKISGKING